MKYQPKSNNLVLWIVKASAQSKTSKAFGPELVAAPPANLQWVDDERAVKRSPPSKAEQAGSEPKSEAESKPEGEGKSNSILPAVIVAGAVTLGATGIAGVLIALHLKRKRQNDEDKRRRKRRQRKRREQIQNEDDD